MNTIFFLRSYGDFIIAINACRNSIKLKSFRFIVSFHLKELFDALPKNLLPAELEIEFYNFEIKHGIMACFTNRFFFTKSAIQEVFKFRSFFKNKDLYFKLSESQHSIFLEQRKFVFLFSLFAGQRLKYIHTEGNIYEKYKSLFDSKITNKIEQKIDSVKPILILIFPGSRKKEKEIPAAVVDYLLELTMPPTISIQQAVLVKGKEKASANNPVKDYCNFSELRDCILSADFIISADSLVAHFSQILDKPHWIMYNKKINNEWITPFAQQSNFFCCFSEREKLEDLLQKKLLL